MYLNTLFNLKDISFVGASAGALAAALTACHVDIKQAGKTAVDLMNQYKVHERTLGLLGVWGAIVKAWLEQMLPLDAAERCSGKASANDQEFCHSR